MEYLLRTTRRRIQGRVQRLPAHEQQAIVGSTSRLGGPEIVDGHQLQPSRRRRPSALRMERRFSRTGRSSTRRSTSAAFSSSRPTISTRRSRSRHGSSARGWAARSRSGRWWRRGAARAGLPRRVGPCPRRPGRLPRRLRSRRGSGGAGVAVAAERWPRDGRRPTRRLAVDPRPEPRDRPPRRPARSPRTHACSRCPTPWRTRWRRQSFPDERLELIFTCCHPALVLEAQVALTLRALGRLTMQEDRPLVPRSRRDDEAAADAVVRAGRRRVGRQARGRPRPGGGQGGGQPRRRYLAVGRAVRAGRRQARARPAPLRRARHRQDDAREGDRDRLQLAVHLDAGLGLRRDLHRDRRDHRPRPRPQGQAARAQVGRPVHRLHRRDRRRRDAPAVARHGGSARRSSRSRPARRPRTSSSSARGARATRPAT